MPITGTRKIFNRNNVDNAPARRGVYALYRGSELLYIGRGGTLTSNIRTRLQAHFAGKEGSCTKRANRFKIEITASPRTRERRLLQDYLDKYGELPPCNDVMP